MDRSLAEMDKSFDEMDRSLAEPDMTGSARESVDQVMDQVSLLLSVILKEL